MTLTFVIALVNHSFLESLVLSLGLLQCFPIRMVLVMALVLVGFNFFYHWLNHGLQQ